jgi:hypothetical protein
MTKTLPAGVYIDKNGKKVLKITWDDVINNQDNKAYPDKKINSPFKKYR